MMQDERERFVWRMNTEGPEIYERYIVPTWMSDLVPGLIRAGRISPGMRVLDAACGTGIVARKAAARVMPGGRIVALDTNEGMLRVAKRCAGLEGAGAIEWYLGDICHMPFTCGEFDTILCQQGLQFFPDRLAALREMKRVLAPGGKLALSVWGRAEKSPHVPVICEMFDEYLGKESADIFRVACSLSDRTVLRSLVRDAGFSGIRIRAMIKIARHPSLAELLPAYFSVFPVAAQITAMPGNERTAMFSCIATALDAYTEDGSLAVPTEHYLLTAENGLQDSST